LNKHDFAVGRILNTDHSELRSRSGVRAGGCEGDQKRQGEASDHDERIRDYAGGMPARNLLQARVGAAKTNTARSRSQAVVSWVGYV
jgi:hypothetical protein